MPEQTEINVELFEKQTTALVKQAKSTEVNDDNSWDRSESLEKTSSDAKKAILAEIKGVIAEVNKKHKRLTGIRARLTEPLDEIIKNERQKRDAYSLQLEAIKEAENQAETKQAQEQDEDVLLGRAEQLESQGRTETASAILEGDVVPSLPSTPVEKSKKVSRAKTVYYGEITDLSVFVAACLNEEGAASMALLEPKTKAIDKIINTLEGNIIFPGITVKSKRVV